jgi:hypothetical protein
MLQHLLGDCTPTPHITVPPFIVQVYADNLLNPPGVNITFTDPESLVMTEESKAALRTALYKYAVPVPFAEWSTPYATPAGELENVVPVDRAGVARTPNDMPGAWV